MHRSCCELLNMKSFYYYSKLKAASNFAAPFIENLTSSNPKYFLYFNRSPACKILSRPVSMQTNRCLSTKIRISERVVLYSHDRNLKSLRVINLFGVSFAIFWFTTAYQFSEMRITPVEQKKSENLPWFARFDLIGSNRTKVIATTVTAFIGCLVFGGAWMYSVRSVGKLILEKGGKSATFVTFNPLTFKMSKSITAPLSEISCQGHRLTSDVVPIKIKGRFLHFLLQKEGKFPDGPLFDRTVGLRRLI